MRLITATDGARGFCTCRISVTGEHLVALAEAFRALNRLDRESFDRAQTENFPGAPLATPPPCIGSTVCVTGTRRKAKLENEPGTPPERHRRDCRSTGRKKRANAATACHAEPFDAPTPGATGAAEGVSGATPRTYRFCWTRPERLRFAAAWRLHRFNVGQRWEKLQIAARSSPT